MTQVICKKCLIADMDFDEVGMTILKYIERIPPEDRTPKEEYDRRLEICRSCDELLNGMCAKCGCYVELRAAKPHMYCASEEKKW